MPDVLDRLRTDMRPIAAITTREKIIAAMEAQEAEIERLREAKADAIERARLWEVKARSFEEDARALAEGEGE